MGRLPQDNQALVILPCLSLVRRDSATNYANQKLPEPQAVLDLLTTLPFNNSSWHTKAGTCMLLLSSRTDSCLIITNKTKTRSMEISIYLKKKGGKERGWWGVLLSKGQHGKLETIEHAYKWITTQL